MAPQHDIHITWPYPVYSGSAFIAGTWSVPGHGPWEQLPMTRIPGTDAHYEIRLNVQEEFEDNIEPEDEGHFEYEHEPTFVPLSSPSLTPTTLSKRQRLSRLFGRSRSSSTASSNSITEKFREFNIDLPFQHHQHHQSDDGVVILPGTRQYKYQYKFIIDGEWRSDPHRHHVCDFEGHWNNEITVDLIEQIQLAPSANRSRSSSLHSQHSFIHAHTELVNTLLPSIPSLEEEDKADNEIISQGESPEDQYHDSSKGFGLYEHDLILDSSEDEVLLRNDSNQVEFDDTPSEPEQEPADMLDDDEPTLLSDSESLLEIKSALEPFVLQAAALPHSNIGGRPKLPPLELDTLTTSSYSQVPSPPLTPSQEHAPKNGQLSNGDESDNDGFLEDYLRRGSVVSEASVPLTPRSDTPSYKKLTVHTQLPVTTDSDDSYDISDDQSSTLSSPLSDSFSSTTSVDHAEEKPSMPLTVALRREVKDESLLWTLCKTTVVVSAAVVVLGLGFGRRRDRN